MNPQPHPVDQAAIEAQAAAQQSETYALVLAAVQAAQLTQQQQPAHVCQHGPRSTVHPGRWLALGAGGSFLAVSLAVSITAVAVSAVALVAALLVLRSIWQSTSRKGG